MLPAVVGITKDQLIGADRLPAASSTLLSVTG
jgi:hypothetical protein